MNKFFLFLMMGVIAACQRTPEIRTLKEGNWFAVFNLEHADVPFQFEVKNGKVLLKNGNERVMLDTVLYHQDSVLIPIKDYDTELRALLSGDSLSGTFSRRFLDQDAGLPFKAWSGDHPRFVTNGPASDSLQGRWDIQFIAGETVNHYVGIFGQQDHTLTGSILTNSGDFRYMEGVLDQDGFRLSSFSGLSPYLVRGQFIDKDHFEGAYINYRGVQTIRGTRNHQAALSDPYSLTRLKDNVKTLGFRLKNLKGEEVSLADARFKDKVVIVSILGSWCPNCLDEAMFLSPWYKANKDRGVELIGLAFERKDDPGYIHAALSNLITKYDITYEILIGGKIGDTDQVLPEIDKLKSYPTTFFIGRDGTVRKIYTGYNGPATGLFYEEFKTDFNKLIDELLEE